MMDVSRVGRVWGSIADLARVEGVTLSIKHACLAYVQAIGATGAGLSLGRGADSREPVFATDRRSEELEELQFSLGEGPAMDAAASNRPVLVGDLDTTEAVLRWPVFVPHALERGAYGIFAFPVSAGAARLGVLDVYPARARPLQDGQLADGLVYADAILMLALDQRGGIMPSLDRLDELGLVERRAAVHQAAGMVSVQLGVGVIDALARLRAYAYFQDRRLADVASAVVQRRLRFGAGDDGEALPHGDVDGENMGEPRSNNGDEPERM